MKLVIGIFGLLIATSAYAGPEMLAGYACFDRDSYIDLMADFEKHDLKSAGKLAADKCISNETINLFGFDVSARYNYAYVIDVHFPNRRSLKMYTFPAWVRD